MGRESRQLLGGRLTRRALLGRVGVAGAGLAGAALLGCASSKPPAAATGTPTAAQGGTAAADRPGVPVLKASPKDGGTWTNAVLLTSPQQDMHTALAASIWHDLSDRALLPDPWTNEMQPHIIEKWEIPDNTHFLLKVRQGIKLHNKPPWNGREFDAEDLAFNINRIAGNTAAAEGLPKTAFQRADTFAGMERVEAVDKYTVRVTMARPSSSWLKGFLEWRNLMMPKGIVEVGFKDPMAFAGMGPYMLTEFVPNVREVLTRAPGYFRQGEPHFDRVVNQVTPDKAASLAGFVSKQFTIFSDPTPQEEKTIRSARPDALYYSTPSNHWPYVWLSHKFPGFSDSRVRKAIQLAINYQEMGDGYYGPGWGYTGLVCAAYPEGWDQEKVKALPGYNATTKAKDREEAQKLISAAGFPNGKGLVYETLTEGASVRHENGIRFQAQMTQFFTDMKVTVKAVNDRAQFSALQNGKNFHALSYSSISQPDPVSEAYSLYHSKGGRNYGAFANPEADALLEKAQVELNPNARRELLATFQQKSFAEWTPIIPLFTQPNRALLQPNIGGYDKVVGPWSSGLVYERKGLLFQA